jgi:hypothetical protein
MEYQLRMISQKVQLKMIKGRGGVEVGQRSRRLHAQRSVSGDAAQSEDEHVRLRGRIIHVEQTYFRFKVLSFRCSH